MTGTDPMQTGRTPWPWRRRCTSASVTSRSGDSFFDDYDLYRMENRFERDANLFASLLLLPDKAVEEFCRPENRGLSVGEAARLWETTAELFAIRLSAEGIGTGVRFSRFPSE